MQFRIHLVVPFRAFPTPITYLLAGNSRWKQKASSLRASSWMHTNLESVLVSVNDRLGAVLHGRGVWVPGEDGTGM